MTRLPATAETTHLIGGNGSDGYVYELGDGRDTIIETGTGTGDHDVIVIAGGLTTDDVAFIRNPNALADLVLQFADGGSMVIKNYFNGGQPNIEGIEFTSGPVWSNTDVAAKAALATLTRNTAPIARDDSYVFSGGKSVTVPIAALLDNDRDPDGDALLITQLSNVTGGTAVLDGRGGVIITRTSDSADAVTFDYTISDGHGGTSRASFSMSLPNQSATNQAPRIISSSLSPAIEDRTATGRITATDSDSETLIYALKEGAGPGKGHVVIKGDGSFTYTPVANANGPEAFTISVSDGTNAPVDAQVSFTIAAVNDKPVAKADSGFVVKSGHTLKIAASSLLKNDSAIDGDSLSIANISGVKGGKAVLLSDGTISFKANAPGAASFTYTVTDGHGGTASALVKLQVTKAPASNPHLIIGTPVADILHGTTADETFVGKTGNDTFVFRAHSGRDQINDFQTGTILNTIRDVLDLRSKGFTGYDDLIDHVHRSGHDTLISFDDGGSVRLKGIDPNTLQFDNFRIF